MTALVITVLIAVSISALCSTLEAMLYSVPWTSLEKMRKSGSRSGKVLHSLRSRVNRPISAILTLNTIANTAGASVAGALAAKALTPAQMPLFAVLFTVLVLLFGEIIPKTIGVAYCERIGRMLAIPLLFLTRIMVPFIWITEKITRIFTPGSNAPEATEDDINAMARLSLEAGSIKQYEETFIGNVLSLDSKHAYDVMTPRTVVFSLPGGLSAEEAHATPQFWNFSRIPVYEDDKENIVGWVLRRDLFREIDGKQGGRKLREIMKPMHFILESVTLDKVLSEFLNRHQHIFAVLDEYGGLAGVITLEDVLEELIGRDIVDESDMAEDLRQLARQRRAQAMQDSEKGHAPPGPLV